MTEQIERIGIMSLRLAVAGIIVPIVATIVFVVLQDTAVIPSAEPYIGLCFLLLVAFQISAFITGRPSRATTQGKIGFRISAWCLGLCGSLFILRAASWYFIRK